MKSGIACCHHEYSWSREKFCLIDRSFEELITEIEEVVKELIPLANLYRSLETGPEYYLVLPTDPYELKRMMVQIETNHPYGRLVDLDILTKTQDQLYLSAAPKLTACRSCYVCEQDAKVCGRSRTHSVADHAAADP